MGGTVNSRMPWISELGKRGVFHVAGLYVLAAWVLVQVADMASGPFPLPNEALRLIWDAALWGFPIALIFGWRYDFTRDGIVRTDPHAEDDRDQPLRRVDYVLIIFLSLVGTAIFAATGLGVAKIVRSGPETLEEAGPHPPLAPNSVAVLPFADMSPGGDQEYFSDGLSEELLNLLARIPQLRVAARTSCFSFKGQVLDVTEIARQLRVAHVLEGSIRRSGDRVRVSAQLIHAGSGYQMWSQIYDREMEDIFAIQNEIAAEVVAQMKVKLLGEAPKAPQADPEAYALFLQARHVAHRVTANSYEQAIELYRASLSIDPEYAAAWAGLARVYGNQVEKGLRPSTDGHRLALEAVNRALAIDPDYAEAHAELAWIAMYLEGDLAEAARLFEHAIDLAPNDAEILYDSATLIQDLGRMKEAIEMKELSIARDPVNPRRHYNLGNAYLFGRRFEAAIDSYRTALTLSPELLGAHYHIGRALLLMGEPVAALEEIETESFIAWRLVGLPAAYHALGRFEEAEAVLAELIEKYERDAAFNIAYIQAFRGETDLAFAWLEKAVQYGDPGLSEISVTPEFDSIRDDPRWVPFLEKIGKSPKRLAAIEFHPSLLDRG